MWFVIVIVISTGEDQVQPGRRGIIISFHTEQTPPARPQDVVMHGRTDIRCIRCESIRDERESSRLPRTLHRARTLPTKMMSLTCLYYRILHLASPRLAWVDTVADEPLRGRSDGILPGYRWIDHFDDDRRGIGDPGFEADQSGWVGQSGEDRV